MEFNRLFEAIQSVRSLCPEVPLLAVPWMRFKHPVHPVQRRWLDSSAPSRRSCARVVLTCGFRGLFSLLYAFYFTARLAQLRARHASSLKALRERRFEVVAKTWRFQSSEASGEDFYYGDLAQRLGRKGMPVLFLYNYPRGGAWKEPVSPADADHSQVQELALLPLMAPLRLVFQQWRTCAHLAKIRQTGRGPESWVAEQGMLDCLSHRYFLAALSHPIFCRAMQIWRPKALLTLYEGHPWEQLAWMAAKEANPSCTTIGYQHTVLFPHQHSLLRPVNGNGVYAKPDIVLCLGPRPAQMLQPSHPRSELIPFGTFRRAARPTESAAPAPHRKTVLVLPEGHAEEMKLLFETAIRAAELLPDHHFILRCHPMFPSPRKQVLSHVGSDPCSRPNVEISEGRGVEEDFARSSVLLYRGSSSVLYAVRFGLKPIYLHGASGPNLDPLFELHDWKEEVRTAEQLAGSLRRLAAGEPASLQREWGIASEFVRSYAIPVDDGSLDRLIQALS